jgi:hypothetical protein
MRICYHCGATLEDDEPHDCWTTTEAALTEDLSDDLREAWERLRETAADFGEQRIYASGSCIMFSRESCYFFVRPKKSFLELAIFLGRAVKAPQVRRIEQKSKTKLAHIVQVRHRDEVEAPITDWLREAYELPEKLAAEKAAQKQAKVPGRGNHQGGQAKGARTTANAKRRATSSRKSQPLRRRTR